MNKINNSGQFSIALMVIVVLLWIGFIFGIPIWVPILGNIVQVIWVFVLSSVHEDLFVFGKKRALPPPPPRHNLKQIRKNKLNKIWNK